MTHEERMMRFACVAVAGERDCLRCGLEYKPGFCIALHREIAAYVDELHAMLQSEHLAHEKTRDLLKRIGASARGDDTIGQLLNVVESALGEFEAAGKEGT